MLNYGNVVASTMRKGLAKASPAGWIRINANSSNQDTNDQDNLSDRKWIEVQFRSAGGLAITYTNRDTDGGFTAPTHNAHQGTIYPANTVLIKPIGPNIMMWGRWVSKADSTSVGGAKLNVVEFK